MANTNAPFGLRPVRHLNGSAVQTNEYPISSTYTTKLYLGHPVTLNAGNVEIGTNNGTAHIGVFAGCKYTNAKGDIVFSKHWTGEAGASNITAQVWDDPQIVFEIQATTAAAANIGTGYDLTIAAGDDTIGRSKTVLNTAAVLGAAYKVLGLVDKPDNESGAYADVEVLTVKHALA